MFLSFSPPKPTNRRPFIVVKIRCYYDQLLNYRCLVGRSLDRPPKDHSLGESRSMGFVIQPTSSNSKQTQLVSNCSSALERPRSETGYSQQKTVATDACWTEDFYRDFDELYKSMCLHNVNDNQNKDSTRRLNSINDNQEQLSRPKEHNSDNENHPSRLNQHQHNLLFPNLSSSPMMPRSPSDFGLLQSSSIVSPVGLAMQQQQNYLHTPICSHGNSLHEGTLSPGGRADSRDTYQSLRDPGPALVEEMTLTDLEDEISFTLMASREMQRNYSNRKKRHSSSLKSSSAGSSHQNRQPMLDRVDNHYQDHQVAQTSIANNMTNLPIRSHIGQRQILSDNFIRSSDLPSRLSGPVLRSEPSKYQRAFNN